MDSPHPFYKKLQLLALPDYKRDLYKATATFTVLSVDSVHVWTMDLKYILGVKLR